MRLEIQKLVCSFSAIIISLSCANYAHSKLVTPSEFTTIINKNLPMMISRDIEYSNAIALKDKFIANYKLINYTYNQVDANFLKRKYKPIMTNKACSTPNNPIFAMNIPFVANYYDMNGNFITSFKIHPRDCK